MKLVTANLLLLLCTQAALADCTDLNRQALPKKAALQAAADEYKSSVASHLRDLMSNRDPPPIVAIAEGVVETSKMIAALDDTITYLRSVLDAGCFGKDASAWSAAIAQFESQRDDMQKDRRLYIDPVSMMARVEDKNRK